MGISSDGNFLLALPAFALDDFGRAALAAISLT